eukprot:7031854-Prymnesium_polylepis.1
MGTWGDGLHAIKNQGLQLQWANFKQAIVWNTSGTSGQHLADVWQTSGSRLARAQIFCARATSGAAETAFPLCTAIEKHIFGILSSSSIHWCNVLFLVDDFHDPGFWGTSWHIEMLR